MKAEQVVAISHFNALIPKRLYYIMVTWWDDMAALHLNNYQNEPDHKLNLESFESLKIPSDPQTATGLFFQPGMGVCFSIRFYICPVMKLQ